MYLRFKIANGNNVAWFYHDIYMYTWPLARLSRRSLEKVQLVHLNVLLSRQRVCVCVGGGRKRSEVLMDSVDSNGANWQDCVHTDQFDHALPI